MARLCREMVNAHLTGVVNGGFTLCREFRPETGPMRTPACLWRQAGPTGAMRPQVIIIGRPNVGKSTLFNRLVGKKLALVDDQPGVTRDRRFGDASLLGLEFTIVDTAGWEDEDPSSLPGRMRMQTEASLEGADVALFVIDARAGLTPLDEEIGRYLRGHDIPVILLANKAEGAPATMACSRRSRWALASRWAFRPNTAKAWATCSRPCCRTSAKSRTTRTRHPARKPNTIPRPCSSWRSWAAPTPASPP
jgi:small GTP-binding protein